MKIQSLVLSMLLFSIEICFSALAENMTLHGVLISPPPCLINSGNKIDVDFGDHLGINKINGMNYEKEIAYELNCSTDIGKEHIVLSLTGQSDKNNPNSLKTSVENLSIQIKVNGFVYTPGDPIVVNPQVPPVISVVPIKQSGKLLAEGQFNTVANLGIYIQ